MYFIVKFIEFHTVIIKVSVVFSFKTKNKIKLLIMIVLMNSTTINFIFSSSLVFISYEIKVQDLKIQENNASD